MLRVSIERLDAYWTAYLGCQHGAFHVPGIHVVAHSAALADYDGIYALRHELACVISAPPARLDAVRDAVHGLPVEALFDHACMRSRVAPDATRIVGPASLAYADASSARTPPSDGRLLTDSDVTALRDLRAACTGEEWAHSGINEDRAPIFGAFDGGLLAAAASWEERAATHGGAICHVGVVAHPDKRGMGFATAAASSITRYGIDAGVIMQWQTLESNAPSLAIARRLGYEPVYRSIAARLS